MKMSLDNYDGLTDPREHVQNVHSSLESIIQDSDSMCMIFPTTFKGSVRAWYNNLKPNYIEGFSNPHTKLVAHFSTSITAKKNFKKLFSVMQQEDKTTQVYLKRFNEEMLKMQELIESVALEALIRGVREHAL